MRWAVDEPMLNGESLPVDKKVGEPITGASINKSGLIHFKATHVGNDTALACIIQMVEEVSKPNDRGGSHGIKFCLRFTNALRLRYCQPAGIWLLTVRTA